MSHPQRQKHRSTFLRGSRSGKLAMSSLRRIAKAFEIQVSQETADFYQANLKKALRYSFLYPFLCFHQFIYRLRCHTERIIDYPDCVYCFLQFTLASFRESKRPEDSRSLDRAHGASVGFAVCFSLIHFAPIESSLFSRHVICELMPLRNPRRYSISLSNALQAPSRLVNIV